MDPRLARNKPEYLFLGAVASASIGAVVAAILSFPYGYVEAFATGLSLISIFVGFLSGALCFVVAALTFKALNAAGAPRIIQWAIPSLTAALIAALPGLLVILIPTATPSVLVSLVSAFIAFLVSSAVIVKLSRSQQSLSRDQTSESPLAQPATVNNRRISARLIRIAGTVASAILGGFAAWLLLYVFVDSAPTAAINETTASVALISGAIVGALSFLLGCATYRILVVAKAGKLVRRSLPIVVSVFSASYIALLALLSLESAWPVALFTALVVLIASSTAVVIAEKVTFTSGAAAQA